MENMIHIFTTAALKITTESVVESQEQTIILAIKTVILEKKYILYIWLAGFSN